jgi:hypothetical protein
LGIGDWGLGIGDWGLGQSPIPNPQSPFKFLTNLTSNSSENKIVNLVPYGNASHPTTKSSFNKKVLPSFLELYNSNPCQLLLSLGSKPGPLPLIGNFLDCVGNFICDYIFKNYGKKIILLNSEVVSITVDKANLRKITDFSYEIVVKRKLFSDNKYDPSLGVKFENINIKSKFLILASGAKQKFDQNLKKELLTYINQKDFYHSDYILQESGYFNLVNNLNNCPKSTSSSNSVKKVVIIGGSHSGFSCAWILLNGPADIPYNMRNFLSNNSDSNCVNYKTKINPRCEKCKTHSCCFGQSDLQRWKDVYHSSNNKYSRNNLPIASDIEISILYRDHIKVYYHSEKEALNDGYNSFDPKRSVNKNGNVYPFIGIRGDAKDLYRKIVKGQEKRVRLINISSINQQKSLLQSSSAVIWAGGYTTEKIRILDKISKKELDLLEDANLQFEVDKELHLMMKNKVIIQSLIGIGQGYSTHSIEVLPNGKNARADSVNLYNTYIAKKLYKNIEALLVKDVGVNRERDRESFSKERSSNSVSRRTPSNNRKEKGTSQNREKAKSGNKENANSRNNEKTYNDNKDQTHTENIDKTNSGSKQKANSVGNDKTYVVNVEKANNGILKSSNNENKERMATIKPTPIETNFNSSTGHNSSSNSPINTNMNKNLNLEDKISTNSSLIIKEDLNLNKRASKLNENNQNTQLGQFNNNDKNFYPSNDLRVSTANRNRLFINEEITNSKNNSRSNSLKNQLQLAPTYNINRLPDTKKDKENYPYNQVNNLLKNKINIKSSVQENAFANTGLMVNSNGYFQNTGKSPESKVNIRYEGSQINKLNKSPKDRYNMLESNNPYIHESNTINNNFTTSHKKSINNHTSSSPNSNGKYNSNSKQPNFFKNPLVKSSENIYYAPVMNKQNVNSLSSSSNNIPIALMKNRNSPVNNLVNTNSLNISNNTNTHNPSSPSHINNYGSLKKSSSKVSINNADNLFNKTLKNFSSSSKTINVINNSQMQNLSDKTVSNTNSKMNRKEDFDIYIPHPNSLNNYYNKSNYMPNVERGSSLNSRVLGINNINNINSINVKKDKEIPVILNKSQNRGESNNYFSSISNYSPFNTQNSIKYNSLNNQTHNSSSNINNAYIGYNPYSGYGNSNNNNSNFDINYKNAVFEDSKSNKISGNSINTISPGNPYLRRHSPSRKTIEARNNLINH